MARPRSDDKRAAITSAAVRVIALQGLSAATATIAKQAGVSNGSLFTYFETKSDLINQLYMELKAEMATAALNDLPAEGGTREQMLHMWSNWLRWATACPEKRRALAHLDVSDEITPASRQAASQAMSGVARLLQRSREQGPMREAPLGLVVGLMTALADATVDFMIRDPANADQHSRATFDALWRMVG
ncbi:TetR/AcrR family transcriptional regulator [Rhodopila sp.]|uniref:TetR/AcrR family transcriptional regulator n=1 Tax=Rhodopila sp. TaxID=2480087 RepID=UPI003D10F229